MSIPTPPNGEITEQVLWLFETNNGCQLPCWWGITPGQTEWSIAELFLNRFDSYIKKPFATDPIYYEPVIPLPTEVFAVGYAQFGILVRNGIVESIDVDVSIGDTPPGYLTIYTLSAILTTYGQPAEVWLATYSSSPGGSGLTGVLPFVLVLFYPDLGIAALYYDNGSKQDAVVQGCPQQDPVQTLSLWSPNQDLTFEEAIRNLATFNYDYLSLNESTEVDLATFYETFKNPNNTTCLETPADLWR